MAVHLVEEILKADTGEIENLLNAVRQRYMELYPEWEVCITTLEKSTDRNEQINRIIALLEKIKTTS